MIRINNNLSIDENEIWFTYARSPGPGGQNVNKVATKTTLHFDVENSPSLSDMQRARLCKMLTTRINQSGVLLIVRSRHRTQPANRRDAMDSFVELLADALRPRKPRKKTKPSRASIKRRLDEKNRHSRLKRQRQQRFSRDGD